MADDKTSLPAGFEDVDLPEGFHPVELTDEEKKSVKHYLESGTGPWEAAAAGLSAAPTEGLSSRLGALGGASAEKIAQAMNMGPQAAAAKAGLPTQSFPELYNEYLKANRQRLQKASEDQPVPYGLAQVAGGLALPWSKLAGAAKLAPEATLVEKLASGAKTGAKMGTAIGALNAPDYTNIPQTALSTVSGTVTGAPLGVGATALTELLGGGAKVTGAVGRSIAGPVGTRFEQGQQAFREGIPSLATQEGLEQAKADASKPVKELLSDIEQVLRKAIPAKAQAVETAGEKYGPLPQAKVDKFYSDAVDKIQAALEKTNDQKTVDELTDLLDKFTTAKEGRLKPVTTRVYAPGKQPPPISAAPQARAPEVMPMPPQQPAAPAAPQYPAATVIPPEAPQLTASPAPSNLPVPSTGGLPAPSPEVLTDQQAIGIEPPPETPTGFEGYKKVLSKTVDKKDKDAIQDFHLKVRAKEAEERVTPGQAAEEPIEVVAEPIEGHPDKMHLIARRKIVQQTTDEFADQAAALDQKQKEVLARQKEAQRLTDLVSKVNQESQDEALKQQAAEAAKPYFEDVTNMERAGGQDIYSPESMSALQEDLAGVSPKFNAGYEKTPSGRLATQFTAQARDLVAGHSPEIQDANTKINATRNIFEALGLDADKLMKGGGQGQREFTKDMNTLYDLFKPETNTPQALVDSILSPDKMKYIQDQLTRIDPALAEKFANTADKQQAMLDLIRDFQKPYAGWSLKSVANAVRSFGGRAAYQAGYALEREKAGMSRMAQPIIEQGRRVWPQFSTNSLKSGAAKAAQNPNPTVQQFGRLLNNLADADERTRNSMLFLMQQNFGYREMMDMLIPQNESETPQAKDKTLQKYK